MSVTIDGMRLAWAVAFSLHDDGRMTMYEKEILELYQYCGIHSFPINCDDIIRKIGYKAVTYQEYAGNDKALYIELMQTSGDAFIIRRERMLYYNATADRRRQVFSKAHELGHIVLVTNDEDEADDFASNLLAPRPVIFAKQLKTAEQISQTFGISISAANNALIRGRYVPDENGFAIIDHFCLRAYCPWPFNIPYPNNLSGDPCKPAPAITGHAQRKLKPQQRECEWIIREKSIRNLKTEVARIKWKMDHIGLVKDTYEDCVKELHRAEEELKDICQSQNM